MPPINTWEVYTLDSGISKELTEFPNNGPATGLTAIDVNLPTFGILEYFLCLEFVLQPLYLCRFLSIMYGA